MRHSEVRVRAAYWSSSVYSVFSGEICPVTGWRNDVARMLWLQDKRRRDIQETEQQNGRHAVVQSALMIPPNEAFVRSNAATGCGFSPTRNVCVEHSGGPAALSPGPQLILLQSKRWAQHSRSLLTRFY